MNFRKSTTLLVASFMAAISLSSCIQGADVEKTDFGSEEKPADILEAINKPLENEDPLDIKVGEYFAIEETQELGGGATSSVLKDTGATITAKSEDANRVVFSGVIHEASYENDGSVSKVSREGNLLCVPKVKDGCGTEEAGFERSALSEKTLNSLHLADVAKLQAKGTVSAVAEEAPRVTYHKLQKSVVQLPAPARVRAQPNCLGIPNCMLTVYRVSFDQVYWTDEGPIRFHYDRSMSPDAPYLSQNLVTCMTAVANVDSAAGSILVKQCNNIFDFRFSSSP